MLYSHFTLYVKNDIAYWRVDNLVKTKQIYFYVHYNTGKNNKNPLEIEGNL